MQMLSVLCSERDKVWRYDVKHDICSALHLVCSSQLLQTGFESRFVEVELLAHGSVDTCAASAPWARQPTASTLCEYFIQINFRVICSSKTREQYWKTRNWVGQPKTHIPFCCTGYSVEVWNLWLLSHDWPVLCSAADTPRDNICQSAEGYRYLWAR